jgi:hypothetical protein
MTVIVDTNVILVANEQHPDVTEQCVVACARRLERIMIAGRIVIDDGYLILKEYQNKTTPQMGKRPGDAFVKWLLRNNANAERCQQVKLVEHAERGFESFPDDERLMSFDPSDRKFVAVAIAHPNHPPIAQAADSKWLGWSSALEDHGVSLDLVCPADIRGFNNRKKGRKGKVS